MLSKSINVNVSMKADTNSIFGCGIKVVGISAISMYISKQRTKRLEIKRDSEKERYKTLNNL